MSTVDTSAQFASPSVVRQVLDDDRLKALRRYNLLDSKPEPRFDRITRIAADLFDVPVALINLVDRERQWFKSRIGVEERETDLDVSVCVFTVAEGERVVIEDLSDDPRFEENPYVTRKGLRFYAGVPLVTPDGHSIGTVCVMDTKPRTPSFGALDRLEDLAAMVMDELSDRIRTSFPADQSEHFGQNIELLRHVEDLANVGGWAYDLDSEDLMWTDQTYRIHELPVDTDIDLSSAIDYYVPESRRVVRSHVETLLESGGTYDLELEIETAKGNRRYVRTIAEAHVEDGETRRLTGAIQDVTRRKRAERLQEVQSTLFERIADGTDIESALDTLCRFTEEQLGNVAVAVRRIDGNELKLTAAPRFSAALADGLETLPLGDRGGTDGIAAVERQTVVSVDVQKDDHWNDHRAVLDEAGVCASWSRPVYDEEHEVIGTLTVHSFEHRRPTPAERRRVQKMAHVASVALERRRRERALRESEERWQKLVDGHPGPIHVTVDGTFVYANKASADLFGVERPEELIGQEAIKFAHPDVRDRIRERARQLTIDREAVPLLEQKIQRSNGEVRTVLVQSVPITYEGEPAAQTMMWDVTERKRYERERRKSEEKFRAVVENARPVVFMVDRDGTFLLSEGQDLKSLGLQPGEVVGESVFDRYGENSAIADGIRRALEGEFVDNEVEVEGHVFDNWYSPFYDENGDVAGVVGMAADITERRETEKELEEQEEMRETIFENLPVMITVVEDGTVTLANEHVESVLGWTDEDVASSTDLFQESYPNPEVRSKVLEVIEEAPDEWLDSRPRAADGQRVDTTWKHITLSDGRTIGIGVDISERKARERALRESNHRLRLALQAANAGTFEYDLETDEVFWDERTLDLYGLDMEPKSRAASVLQDIILDEDLDRLEEIFDQAVEERTSYEVTYRIRRPDGEIRYISSHGTIVPDPTGSPDRVVGINRDVTERKSREQAVREERDRFATLFNNLPTPVVHGESIGDQFVVSTVNPAFEAVFGYDAADVEDKDLHQLIVPENQMDEAVDLARQAREQRAVRAEVERRTTDGIRDFELQVATREQADGPPETYAMYTDITRRRKREQRLRLLEAAVEHSLLPVLITEADPLGEPGPRTVYANPAFTEISGYEVDEIVGKSPRLLQGPDTDPETLSRIRMALEKGEAVRKEVLNYKKDGTAYWNDIYIAPVKDEDGAVTHFVSIQDDVTERIERRKELWKAKEEAEEANRMKAALIANMNHEFRTPLTSIISFSELVQDKPELASEFIDRIAGGGRRLMRTLNTVMDFAEIESDSVEMNATRVDLRNVARSVVNDFEAEATRKGLSLDVDVPSQPVTAHADRHLIGRVLTHLVSNALKFTEEGGATVHVRSQNETVEVTVSDTGIGIESSFLSHAFDEFAQASTGYNRTHEGNGLGLTIVKRLVRRMGGTVEIRSEPGEGTDVTVQFPA